MVFEELSKRYFDESYYEKSKPATTEDKTKLHITMDTEIADDLTKIIAVYRSLNIEKSKLTKSELISVIVSEFIKELEKDESKIYDITVLLNQYRLNQGA